MVQWQEWDWLGPTQPCPTQLPTAWGVAGGRAQPQQRARACHPWSLRGHLLGLWVGKAGPGPLPFARLACPSLLSMALAVVEGAALGVAGPLQDPRQGQEEQQERGYRQGLHWLGRGRWWQAHGAQGTGVALSQMGRVSGLPSGGSPARRARAELLEARRKLGMGGETMRLMWTWPRLGVTTMLKGCLPCCRRTARSSWVLRAGGVSQVQVTWIGAGRVMLQEAVTSSSRCMGEVRSRVQELDKLDTGQEGRGRLAVQGPRSRRGQGRALQAHLALPWQVGQLQAEAPGPS